jgi:hypothetical protein
LNRSWESGHPCLFPDFRGNGFSFFPIKYDVGYNFVKYTFIMLGYIPSIPSFLRSFIMKWFWVLLKAFSVSIEMIKWFLFLFLLMCCSTFNDLHMLNSSFIPGKKTTYSWWMIFLICF